MAARPRILGRTFGISPSTFQAFAENESEMIGMSRSRLTSLSILPVTYAAFGLIVLASYGERTGTHADTHTPVDPPIA